MKVVPPCPTCRDPLLVDRYKGAADFICHDCKTTFDSEDVHMIDRAQRDKPYGGSGSKP